ncbi:MAG: hypothetical protein JST70_15725 [Bacteroidetes bacterium]|nr:hypothetical protein [Bacteroidota bacterium]
MTLQADILIQFVQKAKGDPNLSPTHISLFFALYCDWVQNSGQPFNITRNKIMANSKIRSTATYTRCIYDLKKWGYIEYAPSYHPAFGSRIDFKI